MSVLKILFCGDIVGRSGRDTIKRYIGPLRERYTLDLVIVNGENAAHGFGITPTIATDLFSHGVDVITTGNHIFDQREILKTIDTTHRLLRPLNFPPSTPGKGYCMVVTESGSRILVINAMGRIFMDAMDDPIQSIESLLKSFILTQNADAIILDFHAEATAEKQIVATYFDGRLSAVLGSHTHVPTRDERILPKGTAYISDVGMCGDYNSILGMKSENPIHRYVRRTPYPERMQPSQGEGTLCGVIICVQKETGKVIQISPLIIGGTLNQCIPDILK